MLDRVMRAWRRRTNAAYPAGMGIARGGGPGKPAPPAADLSGYEGLWVAVKDGAVIAAAETPKALVHQLSRLADDVKRDAVMQKAHRPSADILVGMG